MENLSTKRDIKDLKTIVEYCDRIEKALTEFGREENVFLENYFLQSSCAFSLIQIGESVKSLSKRGFCDRNQDVEWSKISKFRDVIAHQYGNIDLQIVWKTSVSLIPELKIRCESIINDLKN
jgi:uncharacterized protein with HEPN domain